MLRLGFIYEYSALLELFQLFIKTRVRKELVNIKFLTKLAEIATRIKYYIYVVYVEGRLNRMQVFVWINPTACCDVDMEHLIAICTVCLAVSLISLVCK
jgi:hypothetical protein